MSKKGPQKGVPKYKTIAMTPRAVRIYYQIQEYVRLRGKFPRYCDIGEFMREPNESENYRTLRNRGVDLIKRYLEPNGYVKRENRRLFLTDKPLTEANLVIPTNAKSSNS